MLLGENSTSPKTFFQLSIKAVFLIESKSVSESESAASHIAEPIVNEVNGFIYLS